MGEKAVQTLTIEELRSKVGRVVYVEDLTIQSCLKKVHPAVIFNWRLKDPYANSYSLMQDVKRDTITAVCPAALAKYAQYFYEENYGKEWAAYEYE